MFSLTVSSKLIKESNKINNDGTSIFVNQNMFVAFKNDLCLQTPLCILTKQARDQWQVWR